jgi:hypothetical protein
MKWKKSLLLLMVLGLLAGCATVPAGPSVAVWPPPQKPFEVFQAEDSTCRQWALQQIGGESPDAAAQKSFAGGTTISTLVGAGIGALIGWAYGNAGAGAAIGAGSGLLVGGMASTEPAYGTKYELQRRYDIAYQQCMYAKGNLIPGSGQRSSRSYPPPPPPPPGYSPRAPVPPQSESSPPPQH